MKALTERAFGSFSAKTPTLAPATHTNSYALGQRDVLLVEPATPYEDEQREWLTWARALRSQGRTLRAIVATHHHPDHVGGLDVLARELDVPVWVHENTASLLDDRARERVTRDLRDGDTIVLEGPTAEAWNVLHTPGHAPGHVCLWEAVSRTLVVGDMVASVGTILIAPGDGDMTAYIEQLERLAALDARVALPAHGAPIDEPTALFERYVRHRRAREASILQSVRAAGPGGASAETLVASAYADTSPALWPLARLSLEAHLEKLVRDGLIVLAEDVMKAFSGPNVGVSIQPGNEDTVSPRPGQELSYQLFGDLNSGATAEIPLK
jgi:glyoxylase-like metal-dependent hydrolase (beta-lactamase superfamily II)